MPVVEKALLAAGTFYTPDGPVTFSDRDIYAFADTTQKMLSQGIQIPVPLEHQNVQAMTAQERLANSVAYNTGWVTGVKVKDGVLYGDLDIRWLPGATSDEDILFRLKNTVKYTSPELYPQFTAGNGVTYRHAMTHCALTPIPVWANQPAFGEAPVAMSRAKRFDTAPAGAVVRLSLRDLWYTANQRAAKAVAWEDWPCPVDLAAQHAPKGGITVAGIFFPGGRFIPNQIVEQASEPERARLEAATEARRAKLKADVGDTSRELLRDRLADHGDLEMRPHQISSTRRAYATLNSYHGDLALHRLHQMVHKDLEKYQTATGPQKALLARRLRSYVHMLDWHQRDEEAKAAAYKATKTGVHTVHPSTIHADPERFQYKVNANKEGVVTGGGAVAGVGKWNPDFAGILHVWHDPADGKDYVINGHHRLHLAKKHGADEVTVRYLDAKDAGEARRRGALINIAEGHGTAVDAAKFLRETGSTLEDLAKHGVAVKGQMALDAEKLSGLAGPLFQKLTTGHLEMPRALALASIKDHDSQVQFANYLERPEIERKDFPDYIIEEMAKEVDQTPTVAGKDGGLFGDDEGHNVFLERNLLKAAVKRRLATERNVFGTVGKEKKATELEKRAKNKLDVEENRRIAEAAEQHRNLFDQEVNLKGHLRDLVDHHAEELYRAKSAKQRRAIEDKLYDAVREHLSRAVAGGTGGGLQGGAGGAAGAGAVQAEPQGSAGSSGGSGLDEKAGRGRLVTQAEIDARRGTGPARPAGQERTAWTRGLEPAPRGPARDEQQHTGIKQPQLMRKGRPTHQYKDATGQYAPSELNTGGAERIRRNQADAQPAPETREDADAAIRRTKEQIAELQRNVAQQRRKMDSVRRPGAHLQSVANVLGDQLNAAYDKLDDLKERRELLPETPRPEPMPSAARRTEPESAPAGALTRADYEAGGFTFVKDDDGQLVAYHPRNGRGKVPFAAGDTEEELLATMRRSEKTGSLMTPKEAKPPEPQRTDVAHGDKVSRKVLVGDQMQNITGTVEKSAGGQLYVRTDAVDRPVWAGGSIPSKRIKLDDEWQATAPAGAPGTKPTHPGGKVTKQQHVDLMQSLAGWYDKQAKDLAAQHGAEQAHNFRGPRPYEVSTHYQGLPAADSAKHFAAADRDMAYQLDEFKKELEKSAPAGASTLAKDMATAERAKHERDKRYGDAAAKLPDGTVIGGWTKQTLGGDPIWVNAENSKGVYAINNEVGSAAVEKALAEHGVELEMGRIESEAKAIGDMQAAIKRQAMTYQGDKKAEVSQALGVPFEKVNVAHADWSAIRDAYDSGDIGKAKSLAGAPVDEMPTWQPNLFDSGATSVATQRGMFADQNKPLPPEEKDRPDLPGQMMLPGTELQAKESAPAGEMPPIHTDIDSMIGLMADKYEAKHGWKDGRTRDGFTANWKKRLDGKAASPEAVSAWSDAVKEAHQAHDVPKVPVFIRKAVEGDEANRENAHYENGFVVLQESALNDKPEKVHGINERKPTVKYAYKNPLVGLYIHELGHKLHDDRPELEKRAEQFLLDDGADVRAEKAISGYANYNPKELVAEAYTMRKHPEFDTLPADKKALVQYLVGERDSPDSAPAGAASLDDDVAHLRDDGKYEMGQLEIAAGKRRAGDHIRDALRNRTQLSRTAWMRKSAPAGADLAAARAAAVRMSLAVPVAKSPEHFLRHFITAAKNRQRVRMSAAHAPKGGEVDGGKEYKGGQFVPGELTGGGGEGKNVEMTADEAYEHLKNTKPVPAGHVRLYRAADSGTAYHGKGTAWGENIETAKAYTDNPGFGGDTLHYSDVPNEYVLDVRGQNRMGFARDVADVVKAMEWDDMPRGLQRELSTIMEWAEVDSHKTLNIGDVATALDKYLSDYEYPFQAWEGERWLFDELGKNYDWVRHDFENFPEGATTWVKISDAPKHDVHELGRPARPPGWKRK